MDRTLFIEIGTEEVPAGYLRGAIDSFSDNLKRLLTEERIKYSDISKYFTPRRLALRIENISEEQEQSINRIKGPPAAVAYSEGKPTESAIGFAKSLGISPDSLKKDKYNGKEYVVADIEEECRETVEILSEKLTDIIENINFPRKMKWEESGFQFARPIRWIVALLDERIINFSVAGVKSSSFSRGHLLISAKKVRIRVDSYNEDMEKEYVVVDFTERKNRLKKEIEHKAQDVDGVPLFNRDLLDEVTNLIEYPFVILGSYDSKFLELPEGVVITAMESHQRYFPVMKNGELIPYFISAVNNQPNKSIVEGNEKVLTARLEDARFYWEVDRKTELEERVKQLSGIVWHRKLGTLLEKSRRLVTISKWIAERIKDVDVESVVEGARLSKADLTTLMIRDGKEFTNLEGYIGARYAEEEGFNEKICRVIEEHYRPRNSEDDLPGIVESAIVSIADRIDLIIGAFIAGEKPTGSRDPLGLRQAFNGLIRIILEFEINISLDKLIDKSMEEYKQEVETTMKNEIVEFIKDRIESYFQAEDIRYDIANAVISEKWNNILVADMVSRAMMDFRQDEDEFRRLVIGQKRVSNILEHTEFADIYEEKLEKKEERQLYSRAKEIEPRLDEFISHRQYMDALELLKELRPYIDNLFDNVMVMIDDRELRKNRLALLSYIRGLFHRISDFEEIVID